MIRFNEAQLADYLTRFLRTKYSRILNPFFRGTITAISGPTGAWLVNLRRPGESSPDGNTYPIANPTYVPRVGEEVLCQWHGRDTAYVLRPVTPIVPYVARVYRNAAYSSSATGSPVNLPYDTVDYDANLLYDLVNFHFTVPAIFTTQAIFEFTAAHMSSGTVGYKQQIWLYKNGVVARQGTVLQSAGDNTNGPVLPRVTSKGVAGDTFSIRYQTSQAITFSIGYASVYAEMAYVGPG